MIPLGSSNPVGTTINSTYTWVYIQNEFRIWN
ncbi:hypothetical protein CEXT_791551, partial [Caerostris extrusa]